MQSVTSRLREMLLQKSRTAASRRPIQHTTASATATATEHDSVATPRRRDAVYIVGERMTPHGCLCCVVQPAHTASSASLRERRARVVVRDALVPGMVVRTRDAACYETLVRSHTLPTEAWRHAVVLRAATHATARTRSRAAGTATLRVRQRTRLAAPACAVAAAGRCARCPWLATAAVMRDDVSLSLSHKASVLRACMARTVHGNNEDNNNNNNAAVTLHEPYAVPVRLHALQEIVYPYVRQRHHSNNNNSNNSSSSSVGDYFAFSAASASVTCNSATCDCASGGGDDDADGDTADDKPACSLATLEQRRLRDALTRWAAQLPPPLRSALRAAFVQQSTHTDATRPWQSDLTVCVCMQRETSLTWRREAVSPLSSTSSSAGDNAATSSSSSALSREEQTLVDAVHASAPLLSRLHVHVCFTDGGWQSLYPRVVRHGMLHDLRNIVAASDDKNNKSSDKSSKETDVSLPVRTCMCYCAPLRCALPVSMPACPSLLLWAGAAAAVADTHERQAATTTAAAAAGTALSSVAPLPLPFWRQCEALTSTASLLLSLLLESVTRHGDSNSNGGCCDVRVYMPHRRTASTRHEQRDAVCDVSAAMAAAAAEGVADAHSGACELAMLLRGAVAQAAATAPQLVRLLSSSSSSSSSSSRTLAVLAHVSDAARDVPVLRTLVDEQRRRQDAHAVRLVLWQCSTTLTLTALQDTVTALRAMRDDDDSGSSSSVGDAMRVAAGVIDVDPLAASLVGYAVIDVATVSS